MIFFLKKNRYLTCGPPGILASLNELLSTVCLAKSNKASVCLLSLNLSILEIFFFFLAFLRFLIFFGGIEGQLPLFEELGDGIGGNCGVVDFFGLIFVCFFGGTTIFENVTKTLTYYLLLT